MKLNNPFLSRSAIVVAVCTLSMIACKSSGKKSSAAAPAPTPTPTPYVDTSTPSSVTPVPVQPTTLQGTTCSTGTLTDKLTIVISVAQSRMQIVDGVGSLAEYQIRKRGTGLLKIYDVNPINLTGYTAPQSTIGKFLGIGGGEIRINGSIDKPTSLLFGGIPFLRTNSSTSEIADLQGTAPCL